MVDPLSQFMIVVVVDALTVAGSEDLRAYLASEELHALTLLDFQIVSALRGLTLAGQLSAARAEDALADFEDLSVQRWPSGDALRRRIFTLRDNLTAYVALAEALECALLTRDARLARSHGHTVQIRVR